MMYFKKTNTDSKGTSCPPESLNKCCKPGPFFNPDYFSHVVVQTIQELYSIPCKLRQDGMVATVVQDNYTDYQLQSSKLNKGVCDNTTWVKIESSGSGGGNLLIFGTMSEANDYISSNPFLKEGQMFYIVENGEYYKYDGQDGLTDPFPNKLEKPSNNGLDNPNYKIPAYLNNQPYWISSSNFIKIKTVNNQEPDGDGNIALDLDYVPLAGTKEGKPLSGAIELSDRRQTIFNYKDKRVGWENGIEKLTLGERFYYQKFDNEFKNGCTFFISDTGFRINFSGNNKSVGIESFKIDEEDYGISTYSILLGTDDFSNKFLNQSFHNRAFAQRAYVDAMQTKPTNWTNPQQQFSGLVSKHNDATYNRLMGMDTNGNLNEVGLPAMTNEMSKSTDAQKDAFRLASRKTNEKFNSNAPVLLVVNPFLLKNSNDFPTSIIITGNNLFIDKESSKVEIRKIKTIDEVPEIGNWIDLTASVSVSELNQNILSIYHNFKLFELGYYEIKVTNHLGLANLTSPLLLIVDNYEETITNPLIIENSHGNIQNTLQVNPKGFELIGNPTVNGGVLFNDLVNIVDSNVNSITKLSLVLNVPYSDYNIGTLSVGFTDVNEISSTTTTTKMGVLLYYYNWGVEIRDMNNGNLKRIQYKNGKILYNMNFYLFIKDGTYSILSENTAAVSEGFYTDLQKLKLMFNIISPAQGRAENYKLSLDIASFKKL